MRWFLAISFLLSGLCCAKAAEQRPFYDRTHESAVLGGPRTYRLFLPASYDAGLKRYPVVYYFHGHSDRYTLEHYDQGKDTVPRIAAFVAAHDLIVVSVDGYVAADYGGFYGGSPWDIQKSPGTYDFGAYFLELVEHIDGACRTLTDRRHRATSGLSMGGFLSLYLSARFADRIGSASAFNPGPEFLTGDVGRRLLWRLKDMAVNHENSMIRLVRASGDYISQYHEEARDAYARNRRVAFEFRQDEYHRHAATSIEETLGFHLRAFSQPALDNTPESWSCALPFRSFSIWDWRADVAGDGAGYVSLEEVSQGGLRVRTRQWAPDGPPQAAWQIALGTAPRYQPGAAYRILDYSLATGRLSVTEKVADRQGRLSIGVDGSGHQIGIAGPGTGAAPPVLLPLTGRDRLRCEPGKTLLLPVRIFNPRGAPMEEVRVELASEYPTVEIQKRSTVVKGLAPGTTADLSAEFPVRFTAGSGSASPARLLLKMTYDGWYSASREIDLLVLPEDTPKPLAVEILDGRRVTLPVFRQKGNQGGGSLIERTVTEGQGNGNGILEPGEEATVWVKMAQGLDPFDKQSWHRARVFSDSPWLEEVRLLEEEKQREWTGARSRASVVRMSVRAPSGGVVPAVLESESWSFAFTPEVRYGREPLYQAFQRHADHLHAFSFRLP